MNAFISIEYNLHRMNDIVRANTDEEKLDKIDRVNAKQ